MSKKNLLVFMFSLASLSLRAFSQNNELSFSVGRAASQHITSIISPPCANPVGCTSVATTSVSGGVTFMGNFSHRITSFGPAAFYLEAPVVGGPSRVGSTTFTTPPFLGDVVPVSASSLFFTPSAKVKFLDASRISPFATVGGGLAHLGLASGNRNTGALQFGGGADFKSPIRHLGLRAEVRDFLAANTMPSSAFTQVSPAHQHTIFAGGGVVFRF